MGYRKAELVIQHDVNMSWIAEWKKSKGGYTTLLHIIISLCAAAADYVFYTWLHVESINTDFFISFCINY